MNEVKYQENSLIKNETDNKKGKIESKEEKYSDSKSLAVYIAFKSSDIEQ